jgi:hypothetical protein
LEIAAAKLFDPDAYDPPKAIAPELLAVVAPLPEESRPIAVEFDTPATALAEIATELFALATGLVTEFAKFSA